MNTLSLWLVCLSIFCASACQNPYRKHEDMQSADTYVQISANDLLNAFTSDENAANGAYLDKVIEVTGIVNSVEIRNDKMVGLSLKTNDPMSLINCEMDKNVENIPPVTKDQQITIKGVCAGYLMDVVLSRVVVVASNSSN